MGEPRLFLWGIQSRNLEVSLAARLSLNCSAVANIDGGNQIVRGLAGRATNEWASGRVRLRNLRIVVTPN
jgi:hypothetical protein